MMHDGFGFGFDGSFMWLFWIGLIILIVWAVKATAGGKSTPSERHKSAIEILKERYANGEIDREEFEQKRKDLTG
ncbi:MAG: SHOCT domain-containing protein [Candidatus Thiodiazotropha endolucinida]|nr:SHOCT domain-containing protein [Candidatus Thiodiazotropha taylori]MCW4315563.1 SHOCT domain-containing protein [Candidatus Thiodiazotropha taylori]